MERQILLDYADNLVDLTREFREAVRDEEDNILDEIIDEIADIITNIEEEIQ